MRTGRTKCILLAGVVAGLLALPAFAQPATGRPTEELLRPPTPLQQDKPPTIRTFITAIVIVGAVVGVALIPSKRGHQD